jgi:large subunit ribosomal protein L22
VKKLLASAAANAKNMGIEKENLFVKEVRVDKGITMKRMMPAAMGSGHRINKRTSNLNILLAEKVVSVPKSKKASAKKESKIVKKEKVTKTTKKSK